MALSFIHLKLKETVSSEVETQQMWNSSQTSPILDKTSLDIVK